jgi:hypothetical protein
MRRGLMYRVYDLTTSLTATATTYATLIVALQAIGASNFSVSTTGQVVATSANGRSVQFGNLGGASPTDFAESAGDLRDLYVQSRADLVTSGIASPTDAQIFTEMMDRLRAIKVATTDFSRLNEYV